MINVGVDQWNYAPVSLATLEALVADAHGEDTKR
jgi:calcineurin-like phosphoesterase family protein